MDGLETHQRSFERYNPDPYGLPFLVIWGLQLSFQEQVKLQTSNLTGTFVGPIRVKAH